jgi:hypothetical protein
MNVKVLQLDGWMSFCKRQMPDEFYLCVKQRITPVFHRDGRYKLGKLEWFEIDGEAYEMGGDFDYELSIMNHCPMRQCVRDAMELLRREGLLTRQQREALYRDQEAAELRDTCRSAYKFRMRLDKFMETMEETDE